jgi:hypothetical protein
LCSSSNSFNNFECFSLVSFLLLAIMENNKKFWDLNFVQWKLEIYCKECAARLVSYIPERTQSNKKTLV